MRLPRALCAIFVLLALLTAGLSASIAAADDTVLTGNEWISLDNIGNQFGLASGAYSFPPALTDDGRSVAFESLAPLSQTDHNGMGDVFVRDTRQNTTDLISVATDGTQGNNRSYSASASADGTFVAFESLATNLVQSDANDAPDLFVHDRANFTTVRIGPADGGDPNGPSYRPSVSGDGRFVAFCSRASNLTSDDTNDIGDAFLWERATGAITRIAVPDATPTASDGCLGVSVNTDGSTVAIAAVTGGTAGVFAFDQAGAGTTALTDGADGPSGTGGVSISGDGKLIAFDSVADDLISGDTNKSRDVFVKDRSADTTTRVSVRTSGSQLPGNSGASGVAISRDGHFVVFGSTARGVVPGDSNGFEDIFRRNLTTGATTIASVNAASRSTNNMSYSPSTNADGTVVAYTSLAANLLPGDGNRQSDVFIRGTDFPDNVGESSGPEDTGAPADTETTASVTADDGGVSPVLLYGGIAAGVVILLAAGSLFLGRRGRA